MPHIAIVFEFSTLNGGERSMLAIMNALKTNAAYKFSAIASAEGDLAAELFRLGIPIFPIAFRDEHGQKFPATVLHENLLKQIRAAGPDLVHGNSLSMARLIGQLSAEDVQVPRTGHLRDIIKLNRTVIRDLNANDRMVAVSEATRQFHVDQGLNPERSVSIYNGVDLQAFRQRDLNSRAHNVIADAPRHEKLLLCVGQICLRKGQLVLAQAVCQLLKQRDDIHLVIAGERHSAKPESIRYEAAIRQVFDEIGRPSRLHMLGYRSDINKLMNAADMLVHASHQEPFGRTLLEAAASGLPIVATNVGGTQEMLRGGKDAILVEPDQPDQLADAITQLLDVPGLAAAFADSARQRVEQNFAIQQAAENLAEFWTGATSRSQ